jgi:hypothetical protein
MKIAGVIVLFGLAVLGGCATTNWSPSEKSLQRWFQTERIDPWPYDFGEAPFPRKN